MKHRVRLAAGLSAFAIAGLFAIPATANPGLLHKHGARPVGVPAMLPGQTVTGGGAATTVTTATPSVVGTTVVGTTPASAVAGVAPGSPGCVVVAVGADGPAVLVADGSAIGGISVDGGPAVDPGQRPICVMPPPDGHGPGAHGGPNVFHKLNPGAIGGNPGQVDGGIVDSGMVMVDGPPGGFVGGGIDAGSVDGAGDMPVVLYAAFPPGGPGADGGGPGFFHHPMSAAASAVASAQTTDAVGSSGRALAGGLPNRAAGVRTDSLATIRHHGHGPITKPAGVAASGDDSHGRVVQAGGGVDDAAGNASHDRQARLAAPAVAGQTAVPATAAPRWRDRLRFAWPTAK